MKKHNSITVAGLDKFFMCTGFLVHRHIIFPNPFTSWKTVIISPDNGYTYVKTGKLCIQICMETGLWNFLIKLTSSYIIMQAIPMQVILKKRSNAILHGIKLSP